MKQRTVISYFTPHDEHLHFTARATTYIMPAVELAMSICCIHILDGEQ